MSLAVCFTGSFVLDSAASESIEPILKISGVPWMIRKLINAAVPKITLNVSGLVLKIIRETSFRSTQSEYVFDGASHSTAFSAGDGEYIGRIEDDGSLVVQATIIRSTDNVKMNMTEKYRILNNGVLEMEIILPDEKELTVRRRFNKV